MLKTLPAVFAVEKNYQIMVQTEVKSLFWVEIADKCFYDESNGIMRSSSELHRVIVPAKLLDEAGEYTVCVRPVIERKPYYTETEETQKYKYAFKAVQSGKSVRAYHISDAHNRINEPVEAAKVFGNMDFLILNGDVIDHSGDPSKFDNVYKICSLLTQGSIPVVFSRGNHDMRGNFAENFAEYTPNAHGNTYYTFRLGSIWGILLDCGEDKDDSHPEYGHTVCCHEFRRRQTEFLKEVIANKEKEYAENGVETRLVIAHNPFTEIPDIPFDIEQDIYGEWTKLLSDEIHPNVMICGHTHKLDVIMPGSERDAYGQSFPTVTGAFPDDAYFAGCGYTFSGTSVKVTFTDNKGNILKECSL